MIENKLVYDEKGRATAFVGPDAVEVFRIAALASGIGLMSKGIRPHRTWTSMKRALAEATRVTGKPYRRTDVQQAISDLKLWVLTMKAALPQEVQS